MIQKKILILIPARYSSTRFMGKPLALISGQSMIQRVFNNCNSISNKEENFDFKTYVVTDHEEIEKHVRTFTNQVVRVDDDVVSGTLRIQLAYERFFKHQNFDLVVNVQGDEPLLNSNEIKNLSNFHFESGFDICTLVKKKFKRNEEFFNSNKVKVAYSEITKRALYFSRAPIPFLRDESNAKILENFVWYLHIGIYSFTTDSLNAVCKSQTTTLEDYEKLEQLRALELGFTIGACFTETESIGVDHPEDIIKIEEVLNVRK